MSFFLPLCDKQHARWWWSSSGANNWERQTIWWHLSSHTWLIFESLQTQCTAHTRTHTNHHYLSRPSTDLTDQPAALWGLNSTQPTTANFLRDNPLGRTGLWNPIKKLTSSLVLAAILISLQACGLEMLETAKRGGGEEKAGFRISWWTTLDWQKKKGAGGPSQSWFNIHIGTKCHSGKNSVHSMLQHFLPQND